MSDDMKDELAEILGEFLAESLDMLQEAEGLLVELEGLSEQGGEPFKKALDSIFRLFHSIKGSSGFLELHHLAALTHEAESFLDRFRTDGAALSPEAVDVLCQATDVVGAVLSVVSRDLGDGVCGPMVQAMVERLRDADKLASDPEPEPNPAQSPPNVGSAAPLPEPEPEPPQAEQVHQEEVDKAPLTPANPAPAAPEPTGRGEAVPAGPVAEATARVSLGKLDALMNLVGELIIAEAAVTHHKELEGLALDGFQKASTHLERITRELQDVAMSMRMVPVRQTFRRLLRVVRDTARQVGKEVELTVTGEDTEMDKSVVEALVDPLMHIIRNAIDHGLESPQGRLDAGKPIKGTVRLEALHQGGEVWIRVSDDGHGLDRGRILAKARERGVLRGEGDQLNDHEVYNLIFKPGFSTASTITSISGRGVGLDVVRNNLERLGGSVDVDSEPGQGTVFTLRIPLTLAIIEGMLVRVGTSKYIVPLLSVRETLRVSPGSVTLLPGGQELVHIRGRSFPLLRLYQLHNLAPDHRDVHDGLILVVEHSAQRYCLFIDEVMGQFQTVIKSLGQYLHDIEGLSGCTILSTGEIGLILDMSALSRCGQQRTERQRLALGA